MKSSRRITLGVFCLTWAACLVAATPRSQDPTQAAPHIVKESFDTVQVDLFENPKDSNFPDEYLVALQQEIVKELVSAKVFPEVVAAGQPITRQDARVIKLSGLITKYNPGSRAARYFGMGGAGAADINSKITFVDATTGRPLMSQELRAVLASGAFGGKSKDAIKDYARQVVNKVKLMQNMRVPPDVAGAAPVAVTAASGSSPSSMPAQQTITITDQDWVGSEQKLNERAANGYRLTGLTITGKHTTDAALARTDATADSFQYKLLHTLLSTSLGKDINKFAAEGFRASPNTLIILNNRPFVIVEKSTPPFKFTYQYILKETLRISSGQKDVEKVQNQGYTLIGETEHATAHILLFEKTSPASQ